MLASAGGRGRRDRSPPSAPKAAVTPASSFRRKLRVRSPRNAGCAGRALGPWLLHEGEQIPHVRAWFYGSSIVFPCLSPEMYGFGGMGEEVVADCNTFLDAAVPRKWSIP